MKTLLFLISLQAVTLTYAQNEENKPYEQIVSFEAIESAILRVFPEAYKDFITITFSQHSGNIYPEMTTFLIPDKYFKKKLDQKELDKRAVILMEQLEFTPACQYISFGEVVQYSWAAWEDKNVRKVTFHFVIGC